MATYTTNFGMTKQAGSENMNVNLLNENFDITDSEINKSRPLPLTKQNVNALPAIITDTRITSTMICVQGSLRLSNNRAMKSDWTITTANGQATITGTIEGTTDIYFWLEEPMV